MHPKENLPRTFPGRTDAEAEAPILGPPDGKTRLTGKDPDAGKHCGCEEKGAAENEMVGWHHRLDGPDFEQTLGHSEGQKRLMCCSPRGHRVGNDVVRTTIMTKYDLGHHFGPRVFKSFVY